MTAHSVSKSSHFQARRQPPCGDQPPNARKLRTRTNANLALVQRRCLRGFIAIADLPLMAVLFELVVLWDEGSSPERGAGEVAALRGV